MSKAPASAGPPPGPTSPLPLTVALLVLATGLVVLLFLPARLAFKTRVVRESSSYAVPVDALGVSQHDVAFGDGRHVLLGRLYGDRIKIAWQVNFFARPVVVTRGLDLDGDGAEEVVCSLADSTGSRAFALDASGRTVALLDSILPESDLPQAPWDGRVLIADVARVAGRTLLVTQFVAGYPGRPRGVALHDPATGRRLWYHDMGGFPAHVRSADLDGDGSSEILVGTYAPDNGYSRGGVDDGHAWLVAIDDDGRRMWQVEMGGPFSVADFAVLPASPGAPARVVATFSSQRAIAPEPGRALLVDGRSGRVLARLAFEGGLLSPMAMDAGAAVATGSEDGWLRTFDEDLRLVHARLFAAPVRVWGSADADDDGRPELVASVPGAVLVLGTDLGVRGRLAVRETGGQAPQVGLGMAGTGHLRIAVHDGRALLCDLHARPTVADPLALASVGALAALAGLAVPAVRRLRGSARRPGGLAAREFLLDYHQIRHETFEHARPFARVRLWAQALAAGQPRPPQTLDDACEEFERIGRPTLDRFCSRAAALQVERRLVRGIRRHTREVARALRAARVAAESDRAARVGEALRAIDLLAQDAYAGYWEVVMRAPCRPSQVAAEATLAKRSALEQGRITARYEAEPIAREPVLFDPDELRALVGELVENAARALAGVPDATLTVRATGHPVDPRRIVLSVIDNGPGLAPNAREDLLSSPSGQRPGGGFGLHRARETAHRWLAELTLEDPPSGTGLEVRLTLRACRIVDHDPPAPNVEART